MGKIRDLFRKIRDTKGTFHAKMGSIKDRNCMDLTEAVKTSNLEKNPTARLCQSHEAPALAGELMGQ